MPQTVLTLTVDNLPEVLLAYDRIRLYRSTVGPGGAFVAITDEATDVPIGAGSDVYTYVDPDGSADTWYRSCYVSSTQQTMSAPSEPFNADADPALSVLSVQDLKDLYLLGMDLTDPTGKPIPDKFFARYIKAAIASVETMLDITLAPTRVTGECHDYIQREADNYYWTQVYKRPVMSVQSFRLHIPGGNPLVFPANWYEMQSLQGVVEVVPKGTIELQPTVGFTPYFSQLFMNASTRRIPNAIEVDYTAGFAPGHVPGDILEFVGKQAAIGPLRTVGNLLLGAGIAGQSIGIDGLSQSVSVTKQGNGAFAAMVSDYQQDLMQMRQLLRGKYHGISMRMA